MDVVPKEKLVAFACERCRGHKVRCERPNLPNDACLRCFKAGVECIAHIARRKPPRGKPVVPKEGLTFVGLESLAGATSSTGESTSQPNSPLQQPLPPSTSVASFQAAVSSPSSRAVLATALLSAPVSKLPVLSGTPSVSGSCPEESSAARVTVASLVLPTVPEARILPDPGFTPASAGQFWELHNDTVTRLSEMNQVIRGISIQHLQRLPGLFKAMTNYFPFVLLPKWPSGDHLLKGRPVLMLAVLTATSHESSSLQRALAAEFRKVATVRVIDGEKSLDLLQGLLVFIAWHHQYMDSQKTSIHTLLRMCTGLLIDLELNSKHAQSSEAKRAYLGCYYLSCCLGIVYGERSQFLPYPADMAACASELASKAEYESDKILPGLIKMCQFLEDVGTSFQASPMPLRTLKSVARLTKYRWDSLKQEVYLNLKDWHVVRWLNLATEIYLFKSVLSVSLVDEHNLVSVSAYRVEALRVCLRSCEGVLEEILESGRVAKDVYTSLSLVDWLNLVYALSTLGSLAKPSTQDLTWNPGEERILQKFKNYRDTLCEQMPKLSDAQDDSDHFVERFRRFTQKMLTTLEAEAEPSKRNIPTYCAQKGFGDVDNMRHQLPPIQTNDSASSENVRDKLPAPPWRDPTCDMRSPKFPWMFLQGTI